MGAGKTSKNEPVESVAAPAWTTPPKPIATLDILRKPVPLRLMLVPGPPWEGLMLSVGESANAGVANPTMISEAAKIAKTAALAKGCREPALKMPSGVKAALTTSEGMRP